MPEPQPVLGIKGLQVRFPRPAGQDVGVVRGVNLGLNAGRTLGLVGESGSGKTMTALALLGLAPYPARILGSVQYQGRELVGLDEPSLEKIRGRGLSIVFQDPATSLNPVFTIQDQLVETLVTHRQITAREAEISALALLRSFDIPAAEKRLKDYPHQLSGGMKQRILIAMAMSCEPDCLLLDEPTTALDVTVQAQILDLVERMQHLKKTSILLISHDLGIVSEISDEIAIMYAGRIVEQGSTAGLLSAPRHPYTRGLMDSIPRLNAHKQRLPAIPGFPPDPGNLPDGCAFHPRCGRCQDICSRQEPTLERQGDSAFACWNPEPDHA